MMEPQDLRVNETKNLGELLVAVILQYTCLQDTEANE